MHHATDLPGAPLLALYYGRGVRPTVDRIVSLSKKDGGFAVVHRPPGDACWLEVLVTGLSFEIHGLAPGEPGDAGTLQHRYGLDTEWSPDDAEAIVIYPGPHLAGGAAMLPVVRGAVALTAALLETGAQAAAWLPGRIGIGRDYFVRTVDDWLSGGPFPAPGLVALLENDQSGITSDGLAFFTGQELEVSRNTDEPMAATAKLATRAVHLIVSNGPLRAPTRLTGPDGESLLAEPSPDGSRVRIWRQT